MGRDYRIKYINRIFMLIFLIICSNELYGQIIHESENTLTESNEIDDEVFEKLGSKMNMNEFLNDENIYSQFITNAKYQAIIKHISETGEIQDLLELQSISGLSYSDYLNLSRIIIIEFRSTQNVKSKIQSTSRTTYTSELDDTYVGSQWGIYQQIKLTLKDGLKIGLSAENDIGEKLSLKGFDHSSFYINKKWNSNEFNIGEFQVNQAFGILVGQGFNSSFGTGGINNFAQHKWNGNASQTEVNTFNGLYYRKRIKTGTFSIGLSNKKVDLGNSTGYHRTLNELNKKNKVEESVIIVGVEQNSRSFFSNYLLTYNSNTDEFGTSIGVQKYYRKTVSFIELAQYNKKFAYTLGIMLLIYNNIQVNISHSFYQNNYTTPWKNNISQGFDENDGLGLVMNLSLPIWQRVNLNYTYKVNKKNETIENKFNEETKASHNVRLDKKLSNNYSCNAVLIFQNDIENRINLRSKFSFKINNQESIQQEYNTYISLLNSDINTALSYAIKYKFKIIDIGLSIGSINIKASTPIYYNIDNLSVGRQSIAIYRSGIVQSLGVQVKVLKKLRFSVYYQNVLNSIDATNIFKLNTSLKYQ